MGLPKHCDEDDDGHDDVNDEKELIVLTAYPVEGEANEERHEDGGLAVG